MAKGLTNDEFLKRLNDKNAYFREGKFRVIGEYRGMHFPVECECPVHGKWIVREAHDLTKGSGCPSCAKENRRISNIEKLKEKNTHFQNDEFRVVGEYVNALTPIACECPIHGIWKSSRPNDLLSYNTGCPKCGNKRKGKKKEAEQSLESAESLGI